MDQKEDQDMMELEDSQSQPGPSMYQDPMPGPSGLARKRAIPAYRRQRNQRLQRKMRTSSDKDSESGYYDEFDIDDLFGMRKRGNVATSEDSSDETDEDEEVDSADEMKMNKHYRYISSVINKKHQQNKRRKMELRVCREKSGRKLSKNCKVYSVALKMARAAQKPTDDLINDINDLNVSSP